jgi:hypothetical protein
VESSSSCDFVYAGTGPDGKVIRSSNLKDWSDFSVVGDCHVRSLAVWANALFIGTQPKGRIYVHNFTTGQEYLFVETEDSAVVAFAEFGGKLYAGTWPIGIVYGFDGTVWREEHRPYGLGVTAMVATPSDLIVFSRGAEGPVAFDGSVWRPLPSARRLGQGQTVASARVVNGGIHGDEGMASIDHNATTGGENARAASPVSPQFNLSAAVVSEDGEAIAGGKDDGVLFSVSDDGLSRVADVGVPIDKMVALEDGVMMASSGGTVFLVTPQGGAT